MTVTCPYCKKAYESEDKICIHCGKKYTKIKFRTVNKTHKSLVLSSMLLGSLVLIFFLWFSQTVSTQEITITIIDGLFILLTIIGVILAGISFKFANTILAVVSITMNIVLVLVEGYRWIVLIFVFFIH